MKQRIDFEKAAEGEAFGVLAVSSKHKRNAKTSDRSPFTPGQRRLLAALANSLLQAIRQSGATSKRVAAGDVSFELHREGAEEILSIRKTA